MAGLTPVLVIWADAHGGEGGWLSLDDYEDDGECLAHTCGFLIPADQPGGKKDHINLWQTICDGEGIHPFHIPAAWVRSVTVLDFPTQQGH